MTRIHVVLDDGEKERYRRHAEKAGMSLGAWLRAAAREKLASEDRDTQLETFEQLRAFFEACDAREADGEPDWNHQRRVIDESRRSGLPNT